MYPVVESSRRVILLRSQPSSPSFLASFLLLLCTLLFAMISPIVAAEKTVDIYNSSVLVVNQSPEVRRQAAAKGLTRVLVRLSGSQDVTQSPKVKAALKRAPDYLDRFGYQSTQATLTIAGAEKPATLLQMRFNVASVKRLLNEANLPLWSERRPDVLVWTAMDKRGKKYVDIESGMAKALNTSASDRGLPIVLPVLDLEDRRALPVTRLWALDENQVRLASQRYATNAVLSGRFAKRSGSWGGSFILTHKGKNRYLNAEGKTESAVAASIINQVSDYLASIYAVSLQAGNGTDVSPSSEGTVTTGSSLASKSVVVKNRGPRFLYLQINNVNDFSTYIAVIRYLETLPLISSVRVANTLRPTLLLDIELAVDKSRFFSELELDQRLQRVAPSTINSSGGDAALEFVWR